MLHYILLQQITTILKMKVNNFKKLYHDTKNRRQKHKYNSIKADSQNNDSLQIYKSLQPVDKIKSSINILKAKSSLNTNSHIRSQSCPFIQPIRLQNKNQSKRISQSMKLNLSVKKKMSIQKDNKYNKDLMKKSQTKKKLNHKQSNSQASQSANTVIVHNVPNDHLSYLLCKNTSQRQFLKKCGSQQSTLHKRSITMKNQLFLKTKLQQRIKKYQLKQEMTKIQGDSLGVSVKQTILQKIIRNYQRDIYTQNQDANSTHQFI